MNNTCDKNCEKYKKRQKCPNYIMTSWREEKTGNVKSLEDCAPKRTLMLMQDLFNRVVGLQQANEEQRNKSNDLTEALAQTVKFASQNPGKIFLDLGHKDKVKEIGANHV
jgi:hypothetical protein